jgi:hypothetical protein
MARSSAAILGLAALLTALFAARLLHTASVKSFTIDEPHYAATGLYLWKTGDYDWLLTLRMHPPLTFHLASLPLLVAGHEDLALKRGAGLARARRFSEAPDRLRFASRLPFVLLSCWGAVLVLLWAREAAGPWAGLLALGLFTFSPTIAAYGPLAHSDITFAIFALQTFYCLWRWDRRRSPVWLALGGVSLGLAMAAKVSGVLLALMVAAVLAARVLAPGAGRSARLRETGVALATLAVLAIGVLWLAYGGSLRIERGPLGPWKDVVAPDYLRALAEILKVNEADHYFWLFGAHRDTAPRWTLAAGFLLKTPLPVLLLAAGAALRWPAPAFRASRLALFAGLPAALYAAVALGITKIPHGVRYLLPLYPLLFVLIGARLADLRRPAARVAVAVCCAWLAVISVRIHPHYLSYFNELIGGPRNAHRYFADTNLDWGQDVTTLAAWLQERGNPPVHTALFSPERPEAHGIHNIRIKRCQPVEEGLVAISVAVLRGVRSPTLVGIPPEGCYDWLKGREPIAQPGYSILVFDLDAP